MAIRNHDGERLTLRRAAKQLVAAHGAIAGGYIERINDGDSFADIAKGITDDEARMLANAVDHQLGRVRRFLGL